MSDFLRKLAEMTAHTPIGPWALVRTIKLGPSGAAFLREKLPTEAAQGPPLSGLIDVEVHPFLPPGVVVLIDHEGKVLGVRRFSVDNPDEGR